jgi:hypothetical protein
VAVLPDEESTAALAERAWRIDFAPSDTQATFFYDLISVLYDLMRWTILLVLLSVLFHTALPALGFVCGASVSLGLAAGAGLTAGAMLCIPYAAEPFAASLFLGLLPPAGIVAFLFGATLLPSNSITNCIAARRAHSTAPSTRRAIVGMAVLL